MRCGVPRRQMRVDVFDRDRSLVDQNADREREAAERHDVDGVPRAPQRDDRRQQRERNRHAHDEGAAPVPQEEQHHQAGQQRPENRFAQHRLQRAGDVARLVQLVADLDVVRHESLEPARGWP